MHRDRSQPTNSLDVPDLRRHALESPPPEATASRPSHPLESLPPTSLLAVPVDPYVIHCEWEVASADLASAKRALGVNEHEYWPALQFYDVTNVAEDDTARSLSFSLDIQLAAANWYVRGCCPEHTYRIDLVLKKEEGSFTVLARSHTTRTPPAAPSDEVDERWTPIRLPPREPETATLMRTPRNVDRQSFSGSPGEVATESAPRSIDMGEEVRSRLAALYPAPQPEAPASAPSASSRLPVDMRTEVRELLASLYSGIQEAPPASLIHQRSLGEPGARVMMRGRPTCETASGLIADLTALNERRFASGVSSGMN